MKRNWSAVVTAGGATPVALRPITDVHDKALIQLNGRSFLDRALSAIYGAGVEEVVVVGSERVRARLSEQWPQAKWTQPGANPVRSASHGLSQVADSDVHLFIPADTPFINAGHLRAFISECERRSIGKPDWLALGVAHKSAIQSALSDAPYKFIRTKGGPYATSSLMAATRTAFCAALHHLSHISENRKSVFPTVRRVGIGNVVKLFVGAISLQNAETIAEKFFGFPSFLIDDVDPLTTFDVDDLADWNYAQRIEITA